jgi:hypothetical protein
MATGESLKEREERFWGEELAEWLNKRDGSAWSFDRRGGEAPDLVYCDGTRELPIEVVSTHYNEDYARMLWGHARNDSRAPDSMFFVEPDKQLLHDIEQQMAKKCDKKYGRGCVLLVTVRPNLTTARTMQELIPALKLPNAVPFEAIYLAGRFPAGYDSDHSYHVWQLR